MARLAKKIVRFILLFQINFFETIGVFSILSPFAKIIERLVSNQIVMYFYENQLFTEKQHGFRARHSCETALETILDKWESIFLDKNRQSIFIA